MKRFKIKTIDKIGSLYYNEIKTLTKRVALAEPHSESGWCEPTGELNAKITSESPPEKLLVG